MVDKPLKIMFFNPLATSAGCDELFAEMARNYKLPQTEVHVASIPDSAVSFTNIEFRTYEAMVTQHIIRATRQAAKEGFDAFVIGCFYDTALHDAREISGEMIVTAPCAASCEIAASISNRFGIIVGRRKWVHQMQSVVREHGHNHLLSGFYHVELRVTEFQADHKETRRRLIEAGRRAIEQDFAEALVLGCTMGVGFYKEVETALGVPVIDSSIAALKRAEYAAALKRQCGWIPSRRWSSEAPPEGELSIIAGLDDGNAFGSRVIVPADAAGA